MEILKIGLVIAAGLGSAYAARLVTDTWLGAPPAQLAGQQAASPATGQAGDTPSPVQEMSREQMEAELKRAQQELGTGAAEDELREFRPSKPLPADLPIALPSNI